MGWLREKFDAWTPAQKALYVGGGALVLGFALYYFGGAGLDAISRWRYEGKREDVSEEAQKYREAFEKAMKELEAVKQRNVTLEIEKAKADERAIEAERRSAAAQGAANTARKRYEMARDRPSKDIPESELSEEEYCKRQMAMGRPCQ